METSLGLGAERLARGKNPGELRARLFHRPERGTLCSWEIGEGSFTWSEQFPRTFL